MKKQPYHEGVWFAVPLRSGGYAVGLAARVTKRPGGILGYFFGPKIDTVPSLSEVAELKPEQALLKRMFGDLALLEGKWPVIGRYPSWDRSLWPVPLFARFDLLRNDVAWVVRYDDNNPDEVLSETPAKAADILHLPRDTTSGAGAIEIILTKLLDGETNCRVPDDHVPA